jgi:hypothetical protein
MVYLALDRSSALEAISSAKAAGHSVWVGSDAVSEEEHRRLRTEGVKLTRFMYPLTGAEAAVVEDALATIEEHHPVEVIWAQHARKL